MRKFRGVKAAPIPIRILQAPFIPQANHPGNGRRKIPSTSCTRNQTTNAPAMATGTRIRN